LRRQLLNAKAGCSQLFFCMFCALFRFFMHIKEPLLVLICLLQIIL